MRKRKAAPAAHEKEDGLTELEREEAEEFDRAWTEKIDNMNPAVPAWQWSGATTPPFEPPAVGMDWVVIKRQPGQSDLHYLATVDPRMPVSQWELDARDASLDHPDACG